MDEASKATAPLGRDQVDQLGGDAGLGPGPGLVALGEGLGPDGPGAAADPAGRAPLLELGEVAADGHLADAEGLGGRRRW